MMKVAKLYEAISKFKDLNLVKYQNAKHKISWSHVSKLMGKIRSPKQCLQRFVRDSCSAKCNSISSNEVPDIAFRYIYYIPIYFF